MAILLFGCDACNWFTSSCIIFFPFASSRYARAVAGGFSGLYSNASNGGDSMASLNGSCCLVEKLVSTIFFLPDENILLKNPFFFGIVLTFSKFNILGSKVSLNISTCATGVANMDEFTLIALSFVSPLAFKYSFILISFLTCLFSDLVVLVFDEQLSAVVFHF